jgi:hypothetical protein
MADIEVTCVEKGCGKKFIVTESGQEFFQSKGWDLPKRCKSCREKRSAAKQQQPREPQPLPPMMGDAPGFSERSDRRRRDRDGNRSRRRRDEMDNY